MLIYTNKFARAIAAVLKGRLQVTTSHYVKNVPSDVCARRKFRSESSLDTFRIAKDAKFLRADNEAFDETLFRRQGEQCGPVWPFPT